MLKTSSRVIATGWREMLIYFSEALNGTPEPLTLEQVLAEIRTGNAPHDFYTFQLEKKYRHAVSDAEKFNPIYFRVHTHVLITQPDMVRVGVGLRTSKKGNQFHAVELNLPPANAREYQKFRFTLSERNKFNATAVVLEATDGGASASVGTILVPFHVFD